MHSKQVGKSHYGTHSYLGKDRWDSYWYQIDLVRRLNPAKVLEIGPGNKTVTEALEKLRIEVTNVDIAEDIEPDIIASVTSLPIPDASYDCVLAAEVLEHIPYEEFPKALSELRRVSKRFVVLSLPHAGYVFAVGFKFPLLRRHDFFIKLPFFWERHRFNGEHYWELGKRGYSVRKIRCCMKNAGFRLRECKRFFDDPAHVFFVLEKDHV